MEEKTLQSVPVMPFALMLACVSGGIGFIIGIVYAVIFSAIFASIPTLTTSTINLGWLSVLIGAGAIIIFPILYFIGGLIFGAIGASLYNFLAPRIGGIKLRFKEEYRPTQP